MYFIPMLFKDDNSGDIVKIDAFPILESGLDGLVTSIYREEELDPVSKNIPHTQIAFSGYKVNTKIRELRASGEKNIAEYVSGKLANLV